MMSQVTFPKQVNFSDEAGFSYQMGPDQVGTALPKEDSLEDFILGDSVQALQSTCPRRASEHSQSLKILKRSILCLLIANLTLFGLIGSKKFSEFSFGIHRNNQLIGDFDISENSLRDDVDMYFESESLLAKLISHLKDETRTLASQTKDGIIALSTGDMSQHDLEEAQSIDGRGGIDHVISLASFYRESINESKDMIFPQKKERKNMQTKINKSRLIESTPIGSPVVGTITSHYGSRRSPFTARHVFHSGIDIAIEHGTPVVASANGVVKFSGRKGGYGKTVHIVHATGKETIYAHLSKVKVLPGRSVKRGQIIGYVGSTGNSTGPHLHYEVWQNGKAIDPLPFIKMASLLNKIKVQ